MFLLTSLRIVYRAAQKWSEHGGTRLGAALAYYAVFSIAPLLLIALFISGAIFGENAAEGEVHKHLEALMGETVAANVENFVLRAADDRKETNWTPTVSIVILLAGALGAFLHVRTSLCMIWALEPPHGSTWLGMLLDYALALIMVFITATLLLISLACGLVVPILQRLLPEEFDELFWHWGEMGASFLFLTLLFATCYRILSGGRVPWGYVWYGAFIAAVLFTIGKTVLSYYIVYSGTESMYGAAGSVVVFLMWVYYSSQILFFGAELIQARRTRHEWMQPKPLTA
jgi:membrane protein